MDIFEQHYCPSGSQLTIHQKRVMNSLGDCDRREKLRFIVGYSEKMIFIAEGGGGGGE